MIFFKGEMIFLKEIFTGRKSDLRVVFISPGNCDN